MIVNVRAVSMADAIVNWPSLMKREDQLFISILCFEDYPIFNNNDKTLVLHFDDIKPSIIPKFVFSKGFRSMGISDGNNIIRFLNNFHKKKEEFIVNIHCAAGVCRSGAVAEFCRIAFNIDQELFNKFNSHILPNQWVLDLLCYLNFENKI